MDKVTCVYTITPKGPSIAAITTAMQNPPPNSNVGVPIPPEWLLAFGLRVESDTTVGTTRTVVIDFGPSAPGAATAVTQANKLSAVNVNPGAFGLDYILPPVVSFTGGGPGGANLVPSKDGDAYPSARAFLSVQGSTIVAGGLGYNAPTTTAAFVGGLPPALFQQLNGSKKLGQQNSQAAPNGPPYALNSVSMVKTGRNYNTITTTVGFDCLVGPGGHPPKAYVSSFGPNGEILAVQVTDPGANLLTVPKITFTDPTTVPSPGMAGTDAKAAALLGAGTPATATLAYDGFGAVNGVVIVTQGVGYVQPPTLVIYDSSGAGSGAIVTPRMGLDRFVVLYGGRGLVTVPTVVLTPAYKAMFPDTSDQSTLFYNDPLKIAIQQALATPVDAAVPVLS